MLDLRKKTRLSPREIETLELCARGYTNREIANIYGISLGTVRTYVYNSMKFLNASSRAHMVVVAISQGWIHMPPEIEIVRRGDRDGKARTVRRQRVLDRNLYRKKGHTTSLARDRSVYQGHST